jgi:hypothetical protein
MMDSEPILPEEYEDPDDEDVFLNDVLDQKARMLSGCRPSSFEPRRDRDRSREMRPPPPPSSSRRRRALPHARV